MLKRLLLYFAGGVALFYGAIAIAATAHYWLVDHPARVAQLQAQAALEATSADRGSLDK